MRLDKVWYEMMSCDSRSQTSSTNIATKNYLVPKVNNKWRYFQYVDQKLSLMNLKIEKYVKSNFECNCENAMLSNPVVW